MDADEFVPQPAHGRVVSATRHVGLGDVRADSRVRLDALARFIQDVADDDASSAPMDDDGVWILRRLTMRIDRTPKFRADVTLRTWCSGTGARWAERRTDLDVGASRCAEAVALWVYTDPKRGPKPLPAEFADIWGVSAGGRKVRPTLRHATPSGVRRRATWPLRAVDLDIVGHVNNAAYWAPVEDELVRRGPVRVTRAEIEFRSGLTLDEPVEYTVAERDNGFACWLSVHGDVRASALVECASL
jgi:acyl-ACP thioesterase